jgi:hypothetical protein
MSLVKETVYLGRDNQIDLVLSEDGTAIADHTVVTRAVLLFGGSDTLLAADPYLTIDSATDPSYFDFSDIAKLILTLGAAPIPKGRHHVRMVVYVSGAPSGVGWAPLLLLTAL